jgi:thiol-disulfide isomerase/thioredoxin
MNCIRFALLVVLLIPACAYAGAPDIQHPDFTLSDLQGQPHHLADYRGKVVIVNFWATWCGPCKHEMPLFADAVKRYGADHVQVIAVSLDDESTRNKIPGFAEKQKMSFPILLGDTSAMQKLGLGEAVPATVFFDGNGNRVARILGEVSKSELKERLESMLGLKSGNPPPELINNLGKNRYDVSVPMMH